LSNLHQRWAALKPPLRPNGDVVCAVRTAIQGHDGRVLLLGVTPELADIGKTLVAVDMSENMIMVAWPGDTDTRRAMCGNWLRMPLKVPEFTAVIGDGSLSFMPLRVYSRLFDELATLLLPDASLAIRLYETPADCEMVAQIRDDLMTGNGTHTGTGTGNGFHAFKWRLAMAIVARTGEASIAVARIHEVFEREFPDRAGLSAASGWSIGEIAEIDAYAGQDTVFSFPTRKEVLAALPRYFANPRFVASGSYELAERCPILCAEFTG
jgi:hypothetical protein